jgi:hypothetical protein
VFSFDAPFFDKLKQMHEKQNMFCQLLSRASERKVLFVDALFINFTVLVCCLIVVAVVFDRLKH